MTLYVLEYIFLFILRPIEPEWLCCQISLVLMVDVSLTECNVVLTGWTRVGKLRHKMSTIDRRKGPSRS